MQSITFLRDKFQNKIFNLIRVGVIASLIFGAAFAAQPVGKAKATAPGSPCISTADDDWNKPSTWTCTDAGIEVNRVPTAFDDVTIDSSVTVSDPESAHNLTINPLGILTVADATPAVTLTITGDFDVQGTFDDHVGGTVKLDGIDQTILTHGDWVDFSNLTKTPPASPVPTSLLIDPGAGGIKIFGTLTLQGAVGNLLTLGSTTPGSQWQIDAEGSRAIDYVSVADSVSVSETGLAGTHITYANANHDGWLDLSSITPLTTTVLTSDATLPVDYGQEVTFTATISPKEATGTVTFTDNGTIIDDCGAQPVAAGTATCEVSLPGSGSHSIIAAFTSDGANGYVDSDSAPLDYEVASQVTTVSLGTSLSPANAGTLVTFTANISPVTAVGTVKFSDNNGPITCNETDLSVINGQAKCTIVAADSSSITAAFIPGGAFDPSTSAAIDQVVLQPAVVTLTASAPKVYIWTPVTFTAQLDSNTATGAVTFLDKGMVIPGCSSQKVSNGKATCTLSNLKVGAHTITAVYGSNALSTSGSALSVSPAPVTVGLRVLYLPITRK